MIWHETAHRFYILPYSKLYLNLAFLLKITSFFVHRKTHNQKDSMIWQIARVGGYVRTFKLVHWTFMCLATPAQTKDEIRLKV